MAPLPASALGTRLALNGTLVLGAIVSGLRTVWLVAMVRQAHARCATRGEVA